MFVNKAANAETTTALDPRITLSQSVVMYQGTTQSLIKSKSTLKTPTKYSRDKDTDMWVS